MEMRIIHNTITQTQTRIHALSSCGNVWKTRNECYELVLYTYQPKNDDMISPRCACYTCMYCIWPHCRTHIHRESESCISTHLSRDHYMRWFIVWKQFERSKLYQCHLILDFLHKIVTKKLKSTRALGTPSLLLSFSFAHTHCHFQILSAHFSMYKETFTNWSLVFIHCYKVFISLYSFFLLLFFFGLFFVACPFYVRHKAMALVKISVCLYCVQTLVCHAVTLPCQIISHLDQR